MRMPRSRAVFLDKDGTLVPNIPYNVDPSRITLASGAGEALLAMAASGYRLYVVSNQSGVARGYFPASALDAVEERLRALLAEEGVVLDGVKWCPHHPEGTVEPYAVACNCRKPQPGMLTSLAAEHGIDLAASWMIGDTLNDVEAGRAAGCRTILVEGGEEHEWRLSRDRLPHHVTRGLAEAARIIAALG